MNCILSHSHECILSHFKPFLTNFVCFRRPSTICCTTNSSPCKHWLYHSSTDVSRFLMHGDRVKHLYRQHFPRELHDLALLFWHLHHSNQEHTYKFFVFTYCDLKLLLCLYFDLPAGQLGLKRLSQKNVHMRCVQISNKGMTKKGRKFNII